VSLFGAMPGGRDEAALRKLSSWKRTRVSGTSLGAEAIALFQNEIAKRQGKLGKLADAWRQHCPEPMVPHCTLSGFARGTLTVLVDSSSHLYELKQMMLAGLERQLLFAGKSAGLRKITLKLGGEAR
jgi:hypothetical protein